jgi:hypothetical protein
MEETLAGAGTQGPREIAMQASSDAAPESDVGTDTPAPEREVSEATDLPHAGADAGPGNVSQGSPAAQAEEVGRGKAAITPRAATNGTLVWRTSTALTGSSVGSQSSASRLQKEWADTASSAGSGEAGQARAGTLTLAKLNKQLTTVRESLQNTGLQFVETKKIVDVSNLYPSSRLFLPAAVRYRLNDLPAEGWSQSFCDQFLLLLAPEFRGSCRGSWLETNSC